MRVVDEGEWRNGLGGERWGICTAQSGTTQYHTHPSMASFKRTTPRAEEVLPGSTARKWDGTAPEDQYSMVRIPDQTCERSRGDGGDGQFPSRQASGPQRLLSSFFSSRLPDVSVTPSTSVSSVSTEAMATKSLIIADVFVSRASSIPPSASGQPHPDSEQQASFPLAVMVAAGGWAVCLCGS